MAAPSGPMLKPLRPMAKPLESSAEAIETAPRNLRRGSYVQMGERFARRVAVLRFKATFGGADIMGFFNGKGEPENGFTVEDLHEDAARKVAILRAMAAEFIDDGDQRTLTAVEKREATRVPAE